MTLDQMIQWLWQCIRMWSIDSSSTKHIMQLAVETSNISLLTNTPQVFILLMMAIQQKTYILGGMIPFQIPAKEKIVSMKGQELNKPRRDLTMNLSVKLSFHTSLSSLSLSKFTLDKITYSWYDKSKFLPRKGLNQERYQNHLYPSHTLILSSLLLYHWISWKG